MVVFLREVAFVLQGQEAEVGEAPTAGSALWGGQRQNIPSLRQSL